jgi:hypothetical protein
MKRTEKTYRPFFTLALLATLMLLVLAVTPTHSQDNLPQINDRAGFRRPTAEVLQLEGQLRGDVETRMSLGLNADVEYVQHLRGSAEDVGSEKFNVPMTHAEYAEMQERWDFASATRDTIMPYVRELPTFAGAYYDHSSDGDLVILLTDIDADARNKIGSLSPAERETRVEIVDYTQSELREAVKMVWEAWAEGGGPEIYAVAVDVPANAVRIEVDATNLEIAEKLVSEVSITVGAPIFVTVGEKPIDAACNNRDDCHSPMKGGIVIRKGSTSGARCTMGFHVVAGSDVQFVTAGHCGYSGSNYWYHQGYGYVGSEQATLYGNNGIDIMRVQMSNSQASESLYDSAASINVVDWPTTGLWVCASLGVSNSWSCGTVSDNYTSWTCSICNCTVYGGDTTLSIIGGDSGSPLVDGNLPYSAIGVMNTTYGKFAIMKDALPNWWNWWIY